MILNQAIFNSKHLENSLKSLQGYTVFHTKNWSSVIDETYQFKTSFIGNIHNGELSSVLPITEIKLPFAKKKGVSLPYTDCCHLLVKSYGDDQKTIEEAVNLGRERDWKFYEYRGGEISGYEYFSLQKYILHTLDINDDISKLKQNLKKRAIRKIKKANNYGMTVEISKNISDLKKFYRLHCITRKRHGLPPQPYIFFKLIYKNLIQQGYGFIALGILKKKVITAQLYLNTNTHGIYKYGASNKKGLEISASYLLMWESIKYFKSCGVQSISLGRTAIENQGLLLFKDSWGAKRENLIYTKIFYNKIKKPKIEILPTAKLIFKYLPIFLLKIIGRLCYQFVG